MNKDTIMIHELRKPLIIDPNLFLTFDDGLYTQYEYAKHLENQKIFFISSGIICPEKSIQSSRFITCEDAHKAAFRGNMANYMTLDQMLELPLGAHSHYHQNLNKFERLIDKISWIKQDTEEMLEFWLKYFSPSVPTSFCFPYNDDLDGLYKAILSKSYGFTDFYGSERINIDDILV